MKRMLREMRGIYTNRVIKEILFKIMLIYVVFGGITWIAVIRNNPIFTWDMYPIIVLLIPSVLLISIPLQWFFGIKPITDRIYKEEKIKREYSFYHHRFTKVK